jgi:heterodisulfide reductase subunit A
MKMSNEEDVRIGVYVCHCGTNIAGTIDVRKVAEIASKHPNVTVARDYKYMCSDPGQALIIDDIKNNNLNRIVVASCSPLLHEETFRTATQNGGLNPYLFQMVNIREHDSWVTVDPDKATEKAISLVKASIKRVSLHKPLEKTRVQINPKTLVVGAGIAGIHAALTLANAGKKVYLVEREPTVGGHMAMFDKTFPTLDCAACILTPKMTSVGSHPNITLWTYSEVVGVDGYVGNFTAKIRKKPRYIIEDACVGCLECIEGCIYKQPKFVHDFDLGLSKRKPVYIPFPQAVPQVVTIDPETCIEVKQGTCQKTCVEACGDRNAIDFTMKEEFEEISIGSIIVATGFKVFNAERMLEYGYKKLPNVYTSLELERILNSSGPTYGEVLLKDNKKPQSIGIIHCVGSRDTNYNVWCSRVCCMYSLKIARLLKEHTDAEIYNFYIDIRTPGKGFEEFYTQVAEEGVNMIRGKVAEVSEGTGDETGKLIVRVEDTLLSFVRKFPLDMVVLSVGLEPQSDAQDVRRMFNIACSTEGFFMEKHPKLAPVNTFVKGIFLAGACHFPKDIPDTVAHAGAAASEALALIDSQSIELEPNTAFIVEEKCSGCRTCIPMCPFTAISRNEEKEKAEINEALCTGCGTCVAACPSSAIKQNLFEDEQIYAEIEELIIDV